MIGVPEKSGDLVGSGVKIPQTSNKPQSTEGSHSNLGRCRSQRVCDDGGGDDGGYFRSHVSDWAQSGGVGHGRVVPEDDFDLLLDFLALDTPGTEEEVVHVDEVLLTKVKHWQVLKQLKVKQQRGRQLEEHRLQKREEAVMMFLNGQQKDTGSAGVSMGRRTVDAEVVGGSVKGKCGDSRTMPTLPGAPLIGPRSSAIYFNALDALHALSHASHTRTGSFSSVQRMGGRWVWEGRGKGTGGVDGGSTPQMSFALVQPTQVLHQARGLTHSFTAPFPIRSTPPSSPPALAPTLIHQGAAAWPLLCEMSPTPQTREKLLRCQTDLGAATHSRSPGDSFQPQCPSHHSSPILPLSAAGTQVPLLDRWGPTDLQGNAPSVLSRVRLFSLEERPVQFQAVQSGEKEKEAEEVVAKGGVISYGGLSCADPLVALHSTSNGDMVDGGLECQQQQQLMGPRYETKERGLPFAKSSLECALVPDHFLTSSTLSGLIELEIRGGNGEGEEESYATWGLGEEKGMEGGTIAWLTAGIAK